MKTFLLSIITLISLKGLAQTSYTGFIDKYPIQLAIHGYPDGNVSAVYAYDKYDTPIPINGKQTNNRLELLERNENGQVQARLVFENFDGTSNKLSGEWINSDSTKKLLITLTKVLGDCEILQAQSTDSHYFKLMISKEDDDRVAGIFGI